MGTARVFRAVVANRDLRRVELAYAGFNITEYAAWIAVLVFAFRRGGTTDASLVAVLQLVPAAACAPFLALLADRRNPARVLIGGYLAQAAGMGATSLAIVTGAPSPAIYAGAIIAATAVTITRPAQAVILPSLARSAEELTATNVVSSWVESGGVLLASVLTGVLLAVSDVGTILAVLAAVALVSAVLVPGAGSAPPAPVADEEGSVSAALAGFAALRAHAHLRALVGMLAGELLLWGAMDVLLVLLAIDVLALGQGWVGYLNAAFGAGGILGGALAMLLVGRRHMAPPMAVGAVAFGGAFVAIAIWPTALAAVLLLLLSGAGRTVFDVACRTLLQRTTPADVLGRVFGLLEGLEMASLAAGALLVPALVDLGGPRAALIGTGLVLPVLGLLLARRLVSVDRGARVPLVEIALLRSLSLFAALPAPATEGLARALERHDLPAGTVVVRAGDEGDRFYVIADGEVEVSRGGEPVARLGRGDGFGEIALLEDVPRTATVTAVGDVRLYSLEKAPFVTAVTGHAPAAQAAKTLVARRRDELERVAAEARATG